MINFVPIYCVHHWNLVDSSLVISLLFNHRLWVLVLSYLIEIQGFIEEEVLDLQKAAQYQSLEIKIEQERVISSDSTSMPKFGNRHECFFLSFSFVSSPISFTSIFSLSSSTFTRRSSISFTNISSSFCCIFSTRT